MYISTYYTKYNILINKLSDFDFQHNLGRQRQINVNE